MSSSGCSARSPAARRAACRRRRRRSPGRRGRSSGGRGRRAARAAPRRGPHAHGVTSSAALEQRGEVVVAQRLHAVLGRQVEVQRGDRDPAGGDGGEVGARLVVVHRRVAVDAVELAAVVLLDQVEPVLVDALAQPRDLDARRSRRPGTLMFSSVPFGSGTSSSRSTTRAANAAAGVEVERVGRAGSPSPALGDCWETAMPGMPEHDALQRGGDRARVGDVVAQVGAVVDAGDDQVGLEALDQPERGEPHAVHRRAVAGVAHGAVVELDLAHPQRAAERDRARRRGLVVVRARPPRARCPRARRSARRSVCSPSASIPSSLVSRTRSMDRRGYSAGIRTRALAAPSRWCDSPRARATRGPSLACFVTKGRRPCSSGYASPPLFAVDGLRAAGAAVLHGAGSGAPPPEATSSLGQSSDAANPTALSAPRSTARDWSCPTSSTGANSTALTREHRPPRHAAAEGPTHDEGHQPHRPDCCSTTSTPRALLQKGGSCSPST